MKHDYLDITSRITEQPTWYDSNGVPRYGEFTPDGCPNIYARQVFLLLISCQDCGEQFQVEMHSGWFGSVDNPRELHYGDPPAHGCVGDTMGCNGWRVLEVWGRENEIDWTRYPDQEGRMV